MGFLHFAALFCSVAFASVPGTQFDPIANNAQGLSEIRFYLWTSDNKWTDGPDHGAEAYTAYNVTGSKVFDITRKTKFLIHGYTNNAFAYSEQMVKNYLAHDDYNIIAMDWAELAGIVLFPIWDAYSTAAGNVVPAAARANIFINSWMKYYKLTPSNLHIVGHSLGAQVAAQVGRNVKATFLEPVGRISGLDPAGPLFVDSYLKQYCLQKTDAVFVDIIHSDGDLHPDGYVGVLDGYFGNLNPMGHIDFFPNGGSSQPGCWSLIAISAGACDHRRSVKYFAESIDGSDLFASKLCETMDDCEYGHTTGPDVIHMGEYSMQQFQEKYAGPTYNASYKFYLTTNADYPYSKTGTDAPSKAPASIFSRITSKWKL